MAARRVLFFNRVFFLDNSSGAAVASRALARCLAGQGFEVEAVCGVMVDGAAVGDAASALAAPERPPGAVIRGDDPPTYLHASVDGVTVTSLRGPLRPYHPPETAEVEDLGRALDGVLERFRLDVFVTYGGDHLTVHAFARARSQGVATVFLLHNFNYHQVSPFENVDAVLVASRFAADYYLASLGLSCTVLPYPIDHDRVRAERRGGRHVTFVNPSAEKGVFAFARMADQLGLLRPDIPLLVVEGRGTEATLASCGLDLRTWGNVNLMAHTPNPGTFWEVTRICLLPSLWWESQPLTAVEAMLNGIPVVGTDRGGVPETLGDAGVVLPLPDRLTPATRMLPTADEVAPWVEAVIRLWDDEAFHAEHRHKAFVEARRWEPAVVGGQYSEFFRNVRPGPRSPAGGRAARAKSVVLVPHLNGIEWECEQGLRKLEESGVRVVRRRGTSAIDVARNEMASEAVHDGYESIFFIDADIGFEPLDALRLLARPEPVVAGVYAKKGNRSFACEFANGVTDVLFGPNAPGLVPLRYAAAGFLRVRTRVLRRMADELRLPLCNADRGRGVWPFFMPLIVPQGEGGLRYLGEDWAFSHRLGLVGVTAMADTSIRLYHWGRYSFGWEDVGADPVRCRSYGYRCGGL